MRVSLALVVLLCTALCCSCANVTVESPSARKKKGKVQAEPRSNDERWMRVHAQYTAEVEASRGQTLDLMVFGDSITESFRGTAFGIPQPKFESNKAAWDTLVTPQYSNLVFSIAADHAVNVLWRLRKGEGPKQLSPGGPRVIMVLAGANDLRNIVKYYPGEPDEAVNAVFHILRIVLAELQVQAPGAKMMMVSLLPFAPFGDERWQLLIDSLNERLRSFAAKPNSGVEFVDCAGAFFEEGSSDDGGTVRVVNRTMIRDGVHPTGKGAWSLAECMAGALASTLGDA